MLPTKLTFKEKQKTLFSRKKKLTEKATKSEITLKKKLDELNIKYIFQKGFIVGEFYCIVDFYIPRPFFVCIEVDGKYHDSPEQKKKDWAKDNYLRSRKFKILRIKNEDVDSCDIAFLISRARIV